MQNISFIVLIIVLISQNAMSQESKEKTNEWIPKIVKYRSYLLRKNPNATIELKGLLDKWDSINATEKDRITMTFNILRLAQVDGSKFKRIQKKIKKHFPESIIGNSLTEKDFLVLKRNSELLDMIHLDLLKSKYPFSINGKTILFKEIESYHIKSTDKIGEIGCGSGAYGILLNILLNRMEPETELYLNELDPDYLEYISLTLKNSENLLDTRKINLVNGNKKTTNLEDLNLDKIIIRNTFHHFEKKDEMLESIMKSLKSEGTLFVLESTIELNQDSSELCEDAMNKETIISIIEQNGFNLVSDLELEENVLLEFSKEEKKL